MTYHRPPQAYECRQGNIAMCLLHSKIFRVQFLFFLVDLILQKIIFSFCPFVYCGSLKNDNLV